MIHIYIEVKTQKSKIYYNYDRYHVYVDALRYNINIILNPFILRFNIMRLAFRNCNLIII